MKTAKEMLENIEMMEQSRTKLLETASELRRMYGEGVEKDACTLENLAAQTENLIEQGYDLYHDCLTSGEAIIADSFDEIRYDLDFIMGCARAIAFRKYGA